MKSQKPRKVSKNPLCCFRPKVSLSLGARPYMSGKHQIEIVHFPQRPPAIRARNTVRIYLLLGLFARRHARAGNAGVAEIGSDSPALEVLRNDVISPQSRVTVYTFNDEIHEV
jgi:hypothetical protein